MLGWSSPRRKSQAAVSQLKLEILSGILVSLLPSLPPSLLPLIESHVTHTAFKLTLSQRTTLLLILLPPRQELGMQAGVGHYTPLLLSHLCVLSFKLLQHHVSKSKLPAITLLL